MDDLRLETSLSMEEIEENFKNFDLFSSMEEGLEAALAQKSGSLSLLPKEPLPPFWAYPAGRWSRGKLAGAIQLPQRGS